MTRREIIECIPNFSTSNVKAVTAILAEIEKAEELFLLDYTYDDYYNRLVVSYVGDSAALFEATLKAAVVAVNLIDMNKHKGQHPRIGAVDVVPFVPIQNASIEDCVGLATRFGEALAEECKLPVYLYAEAATASERRDLDWIRKGGYEKLHEMIVKPGRKPDFGPARAHPTAGATVTGARKLMVGLNVNLGTPDLNIARKIANAVHGKKGGLKSVKAMAAEIPSEKHTQIGMSISDYEKTPLHRVFKIIQLEAERYNIPILNSEFCGMTPLQALIDVASYYLKINNLTADRVVEVAVQKAFEQGE